MLIQIDVPQQNPNPPSILQSQSPPTPTTPTCSFPTFHRQIIKSQSHCNSNSNINNGFIPCNSMPNINNININNTTNMNQSINYLFPTKNNNQLTSSSFQNINDHKLHNYNQNKINHQIISNQLPCNGNVMVNYTPKREQLQIHL